MTAKAWLEADEEAAGFDNIASALDMTPSRYLGYFNAADAAAEAAFGDPANVARIVLCDLPPGDELACARYSLSAFARRAYRRPATAEELNEVLVTFREARDLGLDFVAALKHAVTSSYVRPRSSTDSNTSWSRTTPPRANSTRTSWRPSSRIFFGARARTRSR